MIDSGIARARQQATTGRGVKKTRLWGECEILSKEPSIDSSIGDESLHGMTAATLFLLYLLPSQQSLFGRNKMVIKPNKLVSVFWR
tara:strand:- start:136 stop:393 length:258 start_codon:yes stop_codon:yes gene_type:complete